MIASRSLPLNAVPKPVITSSVLAGGGRRPNRASSWVWASAPGSHRDARADGTRRSVAALGAVEPPGDRGHDLRRSVRRDPDALRDVPGVDEVVGRHLPQVLPGRHRAVREADRSGLVHRPRRRSSCEIGGSPGSRRIVSEQVAGEPVTHLVDGVAGQELRKPQRLPDDVVHDVAHVPAAARRGSGELIGADLPDHRGEHVSASAVELRRAVDRGDRGRRAHRAYSLAPNRSITKLRISSGRAKLRCSVDCAMTVMIIPLVRAPEASCAWAR